ncbi:hypothetical protein PanWU01x14_108030 [Parasponia andersonii]|uniref:Uncharacterized protein n=1 Tax=Parasponia andersonii TaxID=3476 RepID=A0A2P5D0E1_PARAD|nr:hypothetical protein PanWU01x14_108030 [Parasponia andersonii]
MANKESRAQEKSSLPADEDAANPSFLCHSDYPGVISMGQFQNLLVIPPQSYNNRYDDDTMSIAAYFGLGRTYGTLL